MIKVTAIEQQYNHWLWLNISLKSNRLILSTVLKYRYKYN